MMLIVIPRQPLRKITPKYSKRNKGIKTIYYKIFNRKEGSNRGTQEQKRHQTCRRKCKVADANPTLSVIVWDANEIHIPIKRQKLVQKQDSTRLKDINKWKVKGWKNT